MKSRSVLLISAILLGILVNFPTARAVAEKTAGVEFAERYHLGQYKLQLTGTAVLTWALLFDVYAGAFYLPDGVNGAEWLQDVPKRLEIVYFRSFTAKDLSEASDKLLREHLPRAKYSSLAERLLKFYKLFRNIEPGDRYSLSYQPETGTELRLNGQLLGAVSGADFAVAYFGIWLGPHPISGNFRDRLLHGSS